MPFRNPDSAVEFKLARVVRNYFIGPGGRHVTLEVCLPPRQQYLLIELDWRRQHVTLQDGSQGSIQEKCEETQPDISNISRNFLEMQWIGFKRGRRIGVQSPAVITAK